MKYNSHILSLLLLLVSLPMSAQEWLHVDHHYGGSEFRIPMRIDQVEDMQSSAGNSLWLIHYLDKEGTLQEWNWNLSAIDSINVASALSDEEKGHTQTRVFTMHINTLGQAPIYDKEEWINCFISIDGKGEYSDYSGTGRIRGRGNSSWDWYDKKPYKFKLDSKSKLLGLAKARDWNLLANYRDVTKLMNAHAFEVARVMEMPHTGHSRMLEVFLNGDYIGLYQLTEKIEVDNNRVDIDEENGVMLSFDQDDGPSLSPYDGDNFWSAIFSLPVCVKHPEDISEEQLKLIRADLSWMEKAIKDRDYDALEQVLDIESLISILQIHEYLYNVEIDAPRSLYLYRDNGGKWVFGPVWDWDAGYDFDWSDMYTGHTYFSNYRELIYGTDPYRGTGASYRINSFFTSMFGNRRFMKLYKQRWQERREHIFADVWPITEAYYNGMTECGYSRDKKRWPVNKTVSTEVNKMKTWLQNRLDYLTEVINNYPLPTDDSDINLIATIEKDASCNYSNGYHQTGSIQLSATEIKGKLGITNDANLHLIPLNADGTEGSNTAAGTYGAWFDADGNTGPWANGHIFIESDNLYRWSYGCHPDNCAEGHTHTVTMQYYVDTADGLCNAINVKVTFRL